MADVAMYFPGPTPVFAKFPAEVVPAWIGFGWLLVDPNAPVPVPPTDPYPQYVTQAELDGFVAPLLGNPATAVGTAGRAASVSANALALAGSPDLLIAGAITRDANGAATAAPLLWPDGATGSYTATTVSTAFPGAVDAYTVTRIKDGVTITFTQAAVTRNADGAVTQRPALAVS